MQPLMPPINTDDGLFHNGNPLDGTKGTIVTAEHLNNEQGAIRDVQKELIAVLSDAGMAPDADKAGQLLSAIRRVLLNKNNNYFVDTGNANSIVLTPAPALTALSDGQRFDIACAAANTGPVTIKINNLDALPLIGSAGALQGGEIASAKGLISVVWSQSRNSFLLIAQNTSGALQVGPATKPAHAPQFSQVLASDSVAIQSDLLAGTAKKMIDASLLNAVMPSGVLAQAGKLTIPMVIGGQLKTIYILWGVTPASQDSGDTVWQVNFPYAFPTQFLSAQVSLRYPDSVDGNCAVYFFNESKSGMSIKQDKYTSVTAGFIAHWLAIGY